MPGSKDGGLERRGSKESVRLGSKNALEPARRGSTASMAESAFSRRDSKGAPRQGMTTVFPLGKSVSRRGSKGGVRVPLWATTVQKAEKAPGELDVGLVEDPSGSLADFVTHEPPPKPPPPPKMRRVSLTPSATTATPPPSEPSEPPTPPPLRGLHAARRARPRTLARMAKTQWTFRTHDQLGTTMEDRGFEARVERSYKHLPGGLTRATKQKLGLPFHDLSDLRHDGEEEEEEDPYPRGTTPDYAGFLPDGRFLCESTLEDVPDKPTGVLRAANLMPRAHRLPPTLEPLIPRLRSGTVSLLKVKEYQYPESPVVSPAGRSSGFGSPEKGRSMSALERLEV